MRLPHASKRRTNGACGSWSHRKMKDTAGLLTLFQKSDVSRKKELRDGLRDWREELFRRFVNSPYNPRAK